jgi:glycosyltransferase involved in cell wall biosynthesis
MRVPGLTVAIPTMNRWSFLKTQLHKYLDNPKITNVVICDETGDDVEAICQEGYDRNSKLRLYVNDTVLGVYGNKRKCILHSPTEWVAILDSDNRFETDFFDAFWEAVALDGTSPKKTIYAAGENIRLDLKTGLTENRTEHFSGKLINRINWNSVLQTQGWNFLLNDGNWIAPTRVVEHFPELEESSIVGTDSIFMMRQMILAGYTLRLEPKMKYIHTVHDGSHWLQTAAVSSRLLGSRSWTV